jgi:hypothetical protein
VVFQELGEGYGEERKKVKMEYTQRNLNEV